MISMKSILEELYLGNIGFASSGYHSPDSPFVQAARKKADNMDKLTATLDDSQKELFEGYIDAQGDIESITRYATFENTLKFGILLMIEVLTDRQPITADYQNGTP